MKLTLIREVYEDGIEEGIENGIKYGIKYGREEGIENKTIEFAKKLINKGYPKKEILELTEIDEKKLENLLN